MAVMDEYPLGAPCWFELCTSDQAAAKQFYTQLFGWEVFDSPMGPGEYYTMFRLNGNRVGAAYALKQEEANQGVPPHWGVHFATPDVDDTAAKVAAQGGSVVEPPFDVMDVGRMAVCKDPGGAYFSLWQQKAQRGPGVMGEDNTVCWAELATRDTTQARDFYTGLFGWQSKGSANMATYIEFSVAGRPSGGLLPMDDGWGAIPSHWGIYFMVADCDAAAARAKDLGATLRHGPFSAPGVGRMAMMADPQGAGFSIIKLDSPV